MATQTSPDAQTTTPPNSTPRPSHQHSLKTVNYLILALTFITLILHACLRSLGTRGVHNNDLALFGAIYSSVAYVAALVCAVLILHGLSPVFWERTIWYSLVACMLGTAWCVLGPGVRLQGGGGSDWWVVFALGGVWSLWGVVVGGTAWENWREEGEL